MTTKDNFMRMQSRKFGVDWRWRWAEILARNPDRLDWAYADDAVRRAAEFIQQRQSGNGSLKTEAPNLIRLAEQMITDPVAAETLHILVLGDCPRSEIAQRLDVQEDVITTFEELFFDVRAVRTATSCIQHSVIERACHGGRYELASKYRAAFWGGAQVARAVVDGMALVSLDEVDRILPSGTTAPPEAGRGLSHPAALGTVCSPFPYGIHELRPGDQASGAGQATIPAALRSGDSQARGGAGTPAARGPPRRAACRSPPSTGPAAGATTDHGDVACEPLARATEVERAAGGTFGPVQTNLG